MAEVLLQNIKKIYPNSSKKESKRRAKTTPEATANLEVVDKGVVAVQECTLEIKDREFVVLVGPSGCGKSTTLRMIAGLEEITEGDMYIGGTRVNDLPPKARDVAMVFQNYALYPHMTVFENLAFSLNLRHMKKDEIKKRVEEAAAILDITEYLDRKPKALSGGQRQRVAIGRAIVRNPKVFLMDEPLSNLDAKLRNQMRAEIIKLHKRLNTTFIYVTHDQVEAMTLGDRIVIMKDGFIQQIGTPQEVFQHPANLFVAGFIGMPQMNFFSGDLVRSGDDYCVRMWGRDWPLTHAMNDQLEKNEQEECAVTVGVRPSHMVVSDEGVRASLDVMEMMGTELHIHATVDGQEAVIVIPATDTAYNKYHDSEGEICFEPSPEHFHLFDKETGNNLIS